jgi:hypothetical protein
MKFELMVKTGFFTYSAGLQTAAREKMASASSRTGASTFSVLVTST